MERPTWDLIKTPAPLMWQMARKLDVFRDLIDGCEPSWCDRRERALLESVRADIEGN
jgi:hypothetical protein